MKKQKDKKASAVKRDKLLKKLYKMLGRLEKLNKKLEKLGIKTPEDLAKFFGKEEVKKKVFN
jgi:hypothetical protein